ncbi:hypothetical protein RJ639_046833 [Escallonia herrerae]|uniref:2-C-methyl-D-erythritol 2,4-cyclodiphosphate synthase domain-containing protein n=1 Tax=Escallonia herrerae TaxID=1293975 RepID=A0AA88W312_9ASTE|nr:hypothetical protein RJ639_046833 [Escallonia herrerae]
MATSLYYASPVPSKSASQYRFLSPPSVSPRTCATSYSAPPRPSSLVVTAVATTSAVEAERRPAAATPSKSLPFRVRLMHEAGYEIGNLDATLILQRPKLSPHKEAIRANLSLLLGADPSVVNLKAKTHEKVDSLGENRSIAAHTVILLMRK